MQAAQEVRRRSCFAQRTGRARRGQNSALWYAAHWKKKRLTAKVAPDEMPKFHSSYLDILRNSLAASLKKRDKAKERRVDKLLAQSRKRLEENDGKVKLTGSSA